MSLDTTSVDTWIDVDLAAYRRNLRTVGERVAPARLMTVVKNDAYGHGLEPIVRTAIEEGVRFIGVLDVASGLRLLHRGLPDGVRLFAWLFDAEEDYGSAVASGIEIGVSSLDQLARVVETAAGGVPVLHAKIDTGLGRAGARAEDWPALVAEIERLEDGGSVSFAGVWTHIAEASHEEDSASIAAFERAVGVVSPERRSRLIRHLAASAASYDRADSRFDVVRVGAFGYGIAPGDGVSPRSLGLTPVLALRSRVVAVDDAGRGVLPLGTAHGLPTATVDLPAVVGTRRVRVEHIGLTETIVSGAPIGVGDVVTLFGDDGAGEPSLQEWADLLGTIGEEIAVRLSARIERRYPAEH